MKYIQVHLFVLFLLPFFSYAQRNVDAILDTVESRNGPVILYKNFAWEYMGEEPLMMTSEDDSTGIISEGWVNDQVCANPRMTPDSVHDTVLILVSPDKPFCMPVTGKLLRGFMYTHKGLDIRLLQGDTVRAAFDGVVRYARYNRGGFGYLVIIRHYNGLETYYAHLSRIKVAVNQIVRAGDLIGLGGSTGRSRGPHLHFEVRYQDIPLDALRMIDYDNQQLISNAFPITKQVFYPNDWDVTAVYHKIKSGDTLGHLAARYHTSVKEICAMNKIKSTTTLKIGRVLRVK